MGIKIFRDSNWLSIEYITTSIRDIVGLDRVKDRELIEFLILHAPEQARGKLARRFRLTEIPEERINPEDRDDEVYRTYYLFREQVERESDYEALREVAFCNSGSAGKFAFCRLTGYSWPPEWCDAYSYRTFECGLKSDVMREDIEALCREMIEKNGPFTAQAEEWLERLPEISDETLDVWAEGGTERKGYIDPSKELRRFLGTDKGTEYNDEERAEIMRSAFDAYILMIFEEKNGKLPRIERRGMTDETCRVFNEKRSKRS